MPWRKTWHGDEIDARSDRANGRAILGMGEATANAMRVAAHVVSGDLKRSLHVAAPVGAPHEPELERTGDHPLEATRETAEHRPKEWATEVGSWMPYACVENNHGGDHRFADIGWQTASPFFDDQLQRAWREEGL